MAHPVKDYFVHLDGEGTSIVSETVWANLEDARIIHGVQHGLVAVNVVASPPPLSVDMDPPELRKTVRVEKEAIRSIAPTGVRATVSRR